MVTVSTIELHPGSQGESRLAVFNMLGQRVAELPVGSATTGRTTVLLSPEGITTGRYVLVLQQGQRKHSLPVSYLK